MSVGEGASLRLGSRSDVSLTLLLVAFRVLSKQFLPRKQFIELGLAVLVSVTAALCII